MAKVEIIIPGKAISFRSPKAKRYKAQVARIAKPLFKKPLHDPKILIELLYFHLDQYKGDIDNIAKTVLDALNNIAYCDDKQIKKIKRLYDIDLNKRNFLDNQNLSILKPLNRYKNFIYINLQTENPY